MGELELLLVLVLVLEDEEALFWSAVRLAGGVGLGGVDGPPVGLIDMSLAPDSLEAADASHMG